MYSQLFPLTLHNSYAGLFTFNRKSSLLLQWSSKEEKEPIIFLFFELYDQSVLHFLEATLGFMARWHRRWLIMPSGAEAKS